MGRTKKFAQVLLAVALGAAILLSVSGAAPPSEAPGDVQSAEEGRLRPPENPFSWEPPWTREKYIVFQPPLREKGPAGIPILAANYGTADDYVKGIIAGLWREWSRYEITHRALGEPLLETFRQEQDEGLAETLAEALGNVATTSSETAPIEKALVTRLRRAQRSSLQEELIRALGELKAARAVETLEELAGTAEPNAAIWAHAALVKITGNPDGHLDAVVNAMEQGLPSLSYPEVTACECLRWIGPAAAPAVPAIIDRLRDEPSLLPFQLDAISGIGVVGAEDIRSIEEYFLAPRTPVAYRQIAPRAFYDLEGQTELVVSTLIRLYEASTKSAAVRAAMLQALGKIGDGSPAVVARLFDGARSHYPSVRASALRGLGRQAPEHPKALELLLEAGRSDDPNIRAAAVDGLGEMGRGAEEVVPVLIESLSDEQDAVKTRAARALGAYGNESDAAFGALLGVLREERRHVYLLENTMHGLRRMGAAARPAVPLLERFAANYGQALEEEFRVEFRLLLADTAHDVLKSILGDEHKRPISAMTLEPTR